MDLVSVIMPAYNSEAFIAEAIESVLNQTYQNLELIIVDDCSKDKTFQIIKSFSDSRIRFFKLEKNSGSGVARQFAVEKAKGNYIAFLDADDLWKPEKLEKQLVFMKKHQLPFTFSFYEWIDEKGDSLNQIITTPKKLLYKHLYYCNWIGNLTGIYSVDHFGKIPINEIKKRQDWMHWLTIGQTLEEMHPVPESLAYYRIRAESLSSSKVNLLKYNYAVYRQFHKRNRFLALKDMLVFLYTQLLVKPSFQKNLN